MITHLYLSVSDLATRWAVSTDFVYDILRSGQLRAIKLAGTTWRIPIQAVEAYETSVSSQILPSKGRRKKGDRHLVTRL